MTLCYLINSGNWNDPAIWFNGIIPGPTDDVFLNGKNVTVNVGTLSSSRRRRRGDHLRSV
jgi:hypothetical protein